MKITTEKKSAGTLRNQLAKGFTLIEMVIVITIIGILLGAVGYGMYQWIDEARYEAARTSMRNIDLAITGYGRGNYGRPPTQEQGLAALVEKPTSEPIPDRWRSYLDPEEIIDPWGNEFQYRYPAQESKAKYDLWSVGENAEDPEDDVANW